MREQEDTTWSPFMIKSGYTTIGSGTDACWNIYWLLFVFGFLFPPLHFIGIIGFFKGYTRSERNAGIANLVLSWMWIIWGTIFAISFGI